MISRSIRTWREFSRLLKAHGYDFKAPSFSSWSYGRSAVNKTVPSALLEVLKLDEEERAKLADAFAYGQDEKITRDYLESRR